MSSIVYRLSVKKYCFIIFLILSNCCFSQEEFYDHFDDGIIDAKWVVQGLTNANETESHLLMNDAFQDDNSGGPVLSTVTYYTGYRYDITVEVKWDNFAPNNNTTFHVFLGSSEGNHIAYGLYNTGGIQQIWFYAYQNGQLAYNKQVTYTKDHGIFKLKYQGDTKLISAFYKENESDAYTSYPGGIYTHSNFQNDHWVTFICDNWVLGGPCQVKLDWTKIAYSTTGPPLTGVIDLANQWFNIKLDENSGGVMELKSVDDPVTNYVIGKGDYPQYDIDDSRWLGDVVIHYRKASNPDYWLLALTSISDDIRHIAGNDSMITVAYTGLSSHASGIKDFYMIEKYQLANNALCWTIDLTNVTDDTLEFGDVKLPLPFNQYWTQNQKTIYANRVLRHALIALNGSYLYFQKLNGIGPYLVMRPLGDTQIEYYRRKLPGEGSEDDIFKMVDPWYEGLYSIYAYSAVEGKIYNMDWYLPHTSFILTPGEEKSISFEFNWAEDYDAIGEILYQGGLPDVRVFPGMVIPINQQALISIHTKAKINELTVAYSGETQSYYLGEIKPDYHVYRFSFSHIGRNQVTINFNDNKKMVLEFYAIESLETLIKKRAQFIVNHQIQNNQGLIAYKAFLLWDIINKELVTQQNHPELPSYFYTGTDDMGYGPPLFLACKNVYFPEKNEILALDEFLKFHIWGNVQDTTHYGLYAYPGEAVANPFFRSYNYAHLINIYLSMYQIQKFYNLSEYLTAEKYLLRAYYTFKALFTMTEQVATLGLMGESGFIKLIESLEEEGFIEEADWVKNRWDEKIASFALQEYPYGSEITQDATAYEAVHAMARYSNNLNLLDKTNRINIANRSWQPVWYNYGSDNRWMGDSHYRLSYMTQLGGWALMDYALNYAGPFDQAEMIRKAFGAYLAGWATIHTSAGGADPINDGAASWVYHTENGPQDGMNPWTGEQDIGYFGALETAASTVVNDPVFGWVGYGCHLETVGNGFSIYPQDGVRKRIHIAEPRFSLELNRDVFSENNPVTIDKDLMFINFTLQTQLPDTHSTNLTVTGLPEREYILYIDDQEVTRITGGTIKKIELNFQNTTSYNIELVDLSFSGIKDKPDISSGFQLSQNYPNPFNSKTIIKYIITAKMDFEFSIYNIGGELIHNRKLQPIQPGVYTIEWNGKNSKDESVASGVYFYELTSDKHRYVKKMILLR